MIPAASKMKDERKHFAAGTKTDNGESGKQEHGIGVNFYGSATAAVADPHKFMKDTAHWLETSKDTDPGRLAEWFCEDFKSRKIKAPYVLGWLIVQVLGLVFQVQLLSEISWHLEIFEANLVTNCNVDHQQFGVCVGPAWALSYSGTLTFPPAPGADGSQGDFDFIIPSDQTFKFQVLSKPPTFLVGVEPQPPHEKASWQIEMDGGVKSTRGHGAQYKVVTATSHHNEDFSGSAHLKSEYPEAAQVRIYVIDSRIQHLEDIHKQPQCSFEASWQNFNERHNGEHHVVLARAKYATSFFLIVSVCCIALVMHRFYYFVDSGRLLSRIIAVKFVVQDIPQQLCIVAYIYAWFASNGLRCQMCLFQPEHCDDLHPLHWTNFLVCSFTLLSASANQLVFQAKNRRYQDDEECCLWLTRGVLFCVSVLPFSTAMLLLAGSMGHLRNPLIYALILVPTFVGWGTVLCVPTVACCDEEDC